MSVVKTHKRVELIVSQRVRLWSPNGAAYSGTCRRQAKNRGLWPTLPPDKRGKPTWLEIPRGGVATEKPSPIFVELSDHRAIGSSQTLFTTHPSSPGAPFFQPNGTHIFQKLVAFLRAQLPAFGFQEVLTPTIYKKSLWEQSGHWANYKDDMFTVTGSSSQKHAEDTNGTDGSRMQGASDLQTAPQPEEYGLKPMNCPGHCLLFQSERRSYRDLPLRFAEFSPLHRDEVSGALSGLTRVRRFHQDDGHIFCRPSQVGEEIGNSLRLIHLVYDTLTLGDYRLVLSTRPEQDYIGSIEEWDRAEEKLKEALDTHTPNQWQLQEGEGAFYGPKIDVIVQDSNGKEHQTGTIQLDFQLPKRFELAYESPAPDMEAKGEDWSNSESRSTMGSAPPVMIHRAVLGSLERFMALLLEQHKGKVPFWLSPRQIAILTVTDNQKIVQYAHSIKKNIMYEEPDRLPMPLASPICNVYVDERAESLAQKVLQAKEKDYKIIAVVGKRNLGQRPDGRDGTIDVDPSAIPDQTKIWALIESIKPGSQAPQQKDRGSGGEHRGLPAIKFDISKLKQLISLLNRDYC